MAYGGDCSQCGVERQLGDRFCSTCGLRAPYTPPTPRQFLSQWRFSGEASEHRAELTRPYSYQGPPTEVIPVSANPQADPTRRPASAYAPTDPPRPRNELRVVVGLVFAVVALVVGISMFSDDEGDSSAAAAESASNDEEPAATPTVVATATPQPTATSAPTEDASADTTTVDAEKPPPLVSRGGDVTGVAIAQSELGELELPPGTLIRSRMGLPGVTAYDTTTGESVSFDMPNSDRITVGRMSASGAVVRSESDGYQLRPWSGDEPIDIDVEDDQILLRVWDDPDHGLLGITVPNFFDGLAIDDDYLTENDVTRTDPLTIPTWHVVKLLTGEAKEMEVWNGGVQQLVRFVWFEFGSSESYGPRVSQAGTVYRWSWDDGWVVTGEGDLVVSMSGADVVTVCETLTTCRRELRSDDGEVIVSDIGPGPSIAHASLSPDRQRLVALFWADHPFAGLLVPEWRITDLATGQQQPLFEQSNNGFEDVSFTWIGDRLLVSNGQAVPWLIDFETGVETELPALNQGFQSSFTWIPEVIDLEALSSNE